MDCRTIEYDQIKTIVTIEIFQLHKKYVFLSIQIVVVYKTAPGPTNTAQNKSPVRYIGFENKLWKS